MNIKLKSMLGTSSLCVLFALATAGCQYKVNQTNKLKNEKRINDSTIPINVRAALGISDELILQKEKKNLDSLFVMYRDLYILYGDPDNPEEDKYDENYAGEWYMRAVIPYAFDELLKKGFKPIPEKKYREKLIELGFDYTHINSIPIEDKKNYSFYSNNKDVDWYFVKGYNIILTNWGLNNFVQEKNDKPYFCLSNDIIYENLYFFNDSKVALAWLMANDGYFLNSLVKTFGYMGDKWLLKWVAKTNQYVFARECCRQNFLDFSPVLFNYDPDGTYHFHQEMLDVMAEALPDDMTYFYELSGYLDYLRMDPGESIPLAPEVFRNFADQAETVARICYWGEKLVRTHHLELYDQSFLWLFSTTGQDMYDAEFKRRNYYGLDGFEELWEESKKQVEEENKQRPYQEDDRG